MKAVENIKKIPQFFSEVKQELKKVSWSSRGELMGATWVVIAVTIFLAIYIGTIDFGLSKFLTVFLK
ncbi:MAG: preprotein translocase subunit SecE [Candidatus Omnitrophica bacterium]|nr:preprotein translocase subunit SecE [Candidatus Omnitrophota bacterium]MDD5352188.1 preprotein translocase subunit SecE [Candidatus Omnitrophota bacterium]MDD5549786.1 preprotein translocase subunit SecE [Candidatus Omnitrophota bacterium]